MKEEDRNRLIYKYLKGECLPEEGQDMERWLAESEQNQIHFEQIALIERESQLIDFSLDTDSKNEWKNLRSSIQQKQDTKVEAGSSTRLLTISYRKYWKVAAVLALAIAVSGILITQFFEINQNRWAQALEVPKGSSQQVELADGTVVRINADSKMAVDRRYNRKDRRVKLEGEAFFDVFDDSSRPFIVQSGKILIQVLGTSFNLEAYPEDSIITVAVTKGKVRFYHEESEGLALEAGATGVYDTRTDTFRREAFDPQVTLAWMDGRLVFNNEPLKLVFRALERRYNVEIIDRSGFSEAPYTDRSTSEESIREVLDRMALTFGLKVEFNDRIITVTSQ